MFLRLQALPACSMVHACRALCPCLRQTQSVELCVGLHLGRLQAPTQLHAHTELPASHAAGEMQAGWQP